MQPRQHGKLHLLCLERDPCSVVVVIYLALLVDEVTLLCLEVFYLLLLELHLILWGVLVKGIVELLYLLVDCLYFFAYLVNSIEGHFVLALVDLPLLVEGLQLCLHIRYLRKEAHVTLKEPNLLDRLALLQLLQIPLLLNLLQLYEPLSRLFVGPVLLDRFGQLVLGSCDHVDLILEFLHFVLHSVGCIVELLLLLSQLPHALLHQLYLRSVMH